MTATTLSHTWPPFSPLLFARDIDHDLDFDDDLDEFDDPRRKPPRRWLTFVLIILLAVGTWYVMTKPELQSSVMQMVATVRGAFDSLVEDPVPQPEREVQPPVPGGPSPFRPFTKSNGSPSRYGKDIRLAFGYAMQPKENKWGLS